MVHIPKVVSGYGSGWQGAARKAGWWWGGLAALGTDARLWPVGGGDVDCWSFIVSSISLCTTGPVMAGRRTHPRNADFGGSVPEREVRTKYGRTRASRAFRATGKMGPDHRKREKGKWGRRRRDVVAGTGNSATA